MVFQTIIELSSKDFLLFRTLAVVIGVLLSLLCFTLLLLARIFNRLGHGSLLQLIEC